MSLRVRFPKPKGQRTHVGWPRGESTVRRGHHRRGARGRDRRLAHGDETINTERIVVATGSDSLIPPIDGLEQAGYWTNREATTLKKIPASVTVLGGGPVGVELAQMLRRFGSEVHLLEAAERLLNREDERVSVLLFEALKEDQIDVRLDAKVTSVSATGNGRTDR